MTIDRDNPPASNATAAFRRPRARLAAGLVVAALGLAAIFGVPGERRWTDPLQTRAAFEAPAFVSIAADGGLVVIDGSRRRILRLDAEGRLAFSIRGGERGSGRVFYAQEAITGTRGELFVLSYALDEYGYFLEREEILEYGPDGRLRRVLHSVDLRGEARGGLRMGMRHLSRALTARPGGGVDWLELEAEGLRLWRAPADAPAAAERFYPFPAAQMDVAEAALRHSPDDSDAPPEVVVTDKAGRILRLAEDGGTETLYAADASPRRTPDGVPPVPWDVAFDPAGRVVFTDTVFREIRRLASADKDEDKDAAGESGGGEDGRAEIETLFSIDRLMDDSPAFRDDVYGRNLNPGATYFARVWVAPDGALATCSENTVATLSPDKAGRRPSARRDFALRGRDQAEALLSWLGLAAFLFGAALSLYALARGGFRRRAPREVTQAAGLLVVVALTLAATLPIVITRLTERENEIYRRQLKQMLHTIPRLLDADRFARLNRAGDYHGEDYRILRRQVDEILLSPEAADWNPGGYCAIYRFHDGRIYSCLYLNGEVGLYHPFSWEDVEIYRAAYEDGETTVFESRDAMGDWILGVTPLRDSAGGIVAVFEMGTDRLVRSLATRALVRNALLDAVTLLIVLALSLFEFIFAVNLFRAPRPGEPPRVRASGVPAGSPCFAARPLAGLFFAAWSFPAVFVSLRMLELYVPETWPWMSKDMALAAPLSLQLFCFALAVNGGVWLLGRLGGRWTIHLGFLVSAVGLLAAGLAGGMGEFVRANAVLGGGGGLAFIGIRALLARETDPALRDAGFSHFYSGLTAGTYVGLGVGSALAGYLGYDETFMLAAVVMLLAWGAARLSMPSVPSAPLASPAGAARADESDGAPPGGWRRNVAFLSRPAVLAFVILHLLPVYTLGAFIYWYFPLFAEGRGMAVGDIGRLMLLYGLVVIYWGPWASARLLPRMGARRLMLTIHGLWCLSILLFAAWPTPGGAVALLAVFALLEGPGVAGENSYLMRLAGEAKLPEERAAALYETVGKLGETAGPVIFAAAFVLGPAQGMAVLGAAGLAALAVLLFLCPRGRADVNRP